MSIELQKTYGVHTPEIKWVASYQDLQVFEIQEAGWVGNFDLWLRSKYTTEQRVTASILTGDRVDDFFLPVDLNNVNYAVSGTAYAEWVTVFGPVPEPSCLIVLLSGVALVRLVRRRR